MAENSGPFSISISKFIFVMKAIAADDLWDEVGQRLEDTGHTSVLVDPEHMAILQSLLKEIAATGGSVSHRGSRVALSICGPGGPQAPGPRHPPPPPPPPGPGPGGDDDDDDDDDGEVVFVER